MSENQSIPPLLEVHNISKEYELYKSSGTRFLHQMHGRLSPVQPRAFSAVRGVSFDLHRGEAITVFGRNGVGKSTLLQLIAGLTRPTTGSIALPDRVIGLLELASGFNPDFSGRENIWIDAAILGLVRDETRNRLDEIIDFADIGDYLNQPVRTYSSGVFLRLAFAVATAAAPNLLRVDEVLTVGDIFFRHKCYERLVCMRDAGTAVVLVTHALSDAGEFCDRGIVLSDGHMAFSGSPVDMVEYFLHHERATRTSIRGCGVAHYALGATAKNSSAKTRRTLAASEQDGADWTQNFGCVDLTQFEQIW